MLKKLIDKLFPTYKEEYADNPSEQCIDYNLLKNGKIVNTVKLKYITNKKFDNINNIK